MKDLQLYFQCWVEVTKQNRYRDKWLTDETYCRAIKAQFPSLGDSFNRGKLNRAISVCGGSQLDDFSDGNKSGMFRRTAKGVDPFGSPRRSISGYFITTPGQVVERPPEGKKSFLSLLQDDSLNERYSVARGVQEVIDLTLAISTNQHAKRKADFREDDSMMDSTTENTENSSGMKKTKTITCGSDPAPRIIETTEGNYWDSPEAKKLFLGTATDERSVQEVIKQRIERLQGVNRSPHGWKDLIERHDVDNLCSPNDVFVIRQRCQILCLAYMFALEEMNSAKWVDDCCAQAIFVSNGMGVEAATSKRTVAGWNILLRANQEHFPQPDPTIHKDKKPLPDLLEYFREEIMSPWTDYCIGNLADLTVEMARNELVTKIVPRCWEKVSSSASVESSSTSSNSTTNHQHTHEYTTSNLGSTNTDTSTSLKKEYVILKGYVDNPISWATTRRWLQRLGYHYDLRKKTFFVDGHERPNVVSTRNDFCSR